MKNQNKKWVSMRFFLRCSAFNMIFVYCKRVLHKNYFCMFFLSILFYPNKFSDPLNERSMLNKHIKTID